MKDDRDDIDNIRLIPRSWAVWRAVGYILLIAVPLLCLVLMTRQALRGMPPEPVKAAPTKVEPTKRPPASQPATPNRTVNHRRFDVVADLPEGLDVKTQGLAARSVAVLTSYKGGGNRYGSGFLAANELIVTAAHLFDPIGGRPHDEVSVVCRGHVLKGKVLLIDHEADVAVVRAACSESRLKIATNPLKQDERVLYTGFNFDRATMLVTRYVTRTTVDLKTKLLVAKLRAESRATVPTIERLARAERRGLPRPIAMVGLGRRGNSGSPVFRPDGTLIGMVSMVSVFQDRTYFVPASVIDSALERAAAAEAPRRKKKR
jgi:S1-C subfamily serine protease